MDGVRPEPFCLELRLPEEELWSLTDVTQTLLSESKKVPRKEAEEKLDTMVVLGREVNQIYNTTGKAMIFSEAVNFLVEKKIGLNREKTRELIKEERGLFWLLKKMGGKGNPTGLFPVDYSKMSEERRKGFYKRVRFPWQEYE